MPNLKNLHLEDQARFKDLAQAIYDSIANIDRNKFREHGLRLQEGANKGDIVYVAMEARREKHPQESEVDYIARRLTDFLVIERRSMAKVVEVERREKNKKEVA